VEGNILKERGMHDLAKGISRATSLKTLNIAQNKFGDDLKMIDALARAFHNNASLHKINLDGTSISSVLCQTF
jgi:hypothetical protein